MDLYRWNSALALATFDDLAAIEVAMRSAMAQALVDQYGIRWYQRQDILDDATLKLIAKAWSQGKLGSLAAASPEVLHGKLVATLMFGFWVKILGRGGYQGQGPARQRRIYDTVLWKLALRQAFPNVGDLERVIVEKVANQLQQIRNRVAHHEHIIWGVPIPGQVNPDGSVRRISVSDSHVAVLDLAGYLSADLRGWLQDHSQVPSTMARCPLPDPKLLHL